MFTGFCPELQYLMRSNSLSKGFG